MKTLHILLLLTLITMSNIADAALTIGQAFPAITLDDQFGKRHTISNADHLILISFEREVSDLMTPFLSQQKKDFLTVNHCRYISDISAMPSLIAKLFALPAMRDYNYAIMLNTDDDFSTKFNVKAGKLTVYKLKEGIIHTIEYIDGNQINTLFK